MLFSLKYMTPATKNSKCILHYLLNGRLIIQNSSKLFFVLDNIIVCTFIRTLLFWLERMFTSNRYIVT